MTSSLDSSNLYTSTVQSSPASANTALSPHPRLQTSYLPSAHYISSPSAPHHHPLLLAILLHLLPPLPPDSLRVLQWNAGGLRARSTELLHFLSSHPINLICIQESNLNLSSSFRIPGFSALRSDRTHFWSGILSSDTTHASGGLIIFVRQGLSFSELSTSSHSLLHPYSDYVGINISLNNSSSLSFLNVYAPLFAPPQRMAEPTPSLPPFFPPPEISSFWGTSTTITLSGTQEVLLTLTERKYSTGSFPLTSSPSMTLTHQPFSIALLAVAPLLTSPLLPPLWPFLAPGRCYRTWVLTIYQFFYLSLSLWSFTPTSVPLSSIFRMLAGMTLPPTLTLTVLQQRNTHLFLFPLLLLFSPLWHRMRPNLPFLSATSNAVLKPGGLLRWKKRLVKDARLTEVMKIARLTSPLLDAPCQSSPRPRLRHGRQLALLSHLSLSLTLYTLFFALSLALLPRLLPLLTSLTVLLPGNQRWSSAAKQPIFSSQAGDDLFFWRSPTL